MLVTDKDITTILAAYTKAYKKTGTSYQPIMEGDRLSSDQKGSMLPVILNQQEGITESTYEETTDSMVNKIVIYNQKNKKIGTVSNKNWAKTYGTFQESITVEREMEKSKQKIRLLVLKRLHH